MQKRGGHGHLNRLSELLDQEMRRVHKASNEQPPVYEASCTGAQEVSLVEGSEFTFLGNYLVIRISSDDTGPVEGYEQDFDVP